MWWMSHRSRTRLAVKRPWVQSQRRKGRRKKEIKKKKQGTDSPALTFWESFSAIRKLQEQPEDILFGTCIPSVLHWSRALKPQDRSQRDSTHGCSVQHLHWLQIPSVTAFMFRKVCLLSLILWPPKSQASGSCATFAIQPDASGPANDQMDEWTH